MRAEVQQHLLSHIEGEWRTLLRFSPRPWGAWIRRYPLNAAPPDSPLRKQAVPLAVWFLDRHGISRKSVCEYRKYAVMQLEQSWCKRPFGEPSPAGGRLFEIGQAAFAPVPIDDEFYVELQWGGLYGEGRLVALGPGGSVNLKHRLWVS